MLCYKLIMKQMYETKFRQSNVMCTGNLYQRSLFKMADTVHKIKCQTVIYKRTQTMGLVFRTKHNLTRWNLLNSIKIWGDNKIKNLNNYIKI